MRKLVVMLASLLLLYGCTFPVSADTDKSVDYYGTPITQLYESMSANKRIQLTGEYDKDKSIFMLVYPTYLADAAAAEREGSTVRNIFIDNYARRASRLLADENLPVFKDMLKRNALLAHTEQEEHHLQIGYCKESGILASGDYFYCFEFEGNIYKVIDKVDFLDKGTHQIRRAWVYMFFKEGKFEDYFKPGPYGVIPTPRVSGYGFEPRIFIN